jgi:2-iminobutanoate/2-iminopropanoate deaminase
MALYPSRFSLPKLAPLAVAIGVIGLACINVGANRGPQETVPLSSLPFSPAKKAGPTIYVSGQVARTPENKDIRDSVAAETRQVMENLGKILKDNGCTFDDVVNVTVYLHDIKDYPEMNKAYSEYFKNGFPARATIGGVDLAFGFRLEISCVAYKAER